VYISTTAIGSMTGAITFRQNGATSDADILLIALRIILASCSRSGAAPSFGWPTERRRASLERCSWFGALARTHVHGDHVVYAFMGGTDAAIPQTALLAQNGDLYGTTPEGGTAGLGPSIKWYLW